VFDSVAGVQPQSETVWRQADKYRVPRICFVNKMDRMGADFDHVIRTIKQRLGARPVPLQFPLGREDNFIGIIDFLEQKVVVWLEETLGAKYEVFEVEKLWDKAFVDSRPDVAAALKGAAIDKKFYEEHRNKVIEYIAEHDDELVDKYLNGETLTLEEMRAAIEEARKAGRRTAAHAQGSTGIADAIEAGITSDCVAKASSNDRKTGAWRPERGARPVSGVRYSSTANCGIPSATSIIRSA